MKTGELLLVIMASLFLFVLWHEKQFVTTASGVLSSNFKLTGAGGLNITAKQWWMVYLYQHGLVPYSELAGVPQQLLSYAQVGPSLQGPYAPLRL